MQPFDALSAPLSGTALIEASAGTGKTYTIAGLFVRMILERQLEVGQILVVTYTTAATEELKSRIRRKLARTRRALLQGHSRDPFIAGLIATVDSPKAAVRRIDAALADFDRAAIMTIHGFCQRMLQAHAFETGTVYGAQLTTDPTAILQEVAEDYWRKNLYGATPELIGFLFKHKKIAGPQTFYRLAKHVAIADLQILPAPRRPRLTHLDQYRRLRRRLTADWAAVREKVGERLMDPALSARVYGRPQADRRSGGPSARELKVAALIASMDRFAAATTTGFPPFDGFDKFTTSGLKRATKKNRVPPVHGFFDLCDRLGTAGACLMTELERYDLYLRSAFFSFADAALAENKRRHNRLFYDDLLLRVRAALSEKAAGAEILMAAVRQRFKAALVDEFQDTDAVQAAIFSRLFAPAPAIFFMIGDPKQSIYGFRGADIFAYLEAAGKTAAKYTLDTNWRSEAGMVKAVNALFGGLPKPFVHAGIDFEMARAGRGADGPATDTAPALTLWYLAAPDGKPLAKGDALRRITAAVGDEIARLISSRDAPVSPAEIAVLVRTNRQAQQVKASLAARGVSCVLYGAGNVFDTAEAGEILRVLTGVLEHGRDERFRAALATDMLGVTAPVIAAAAAGGPHLDQRRERFRAYAREWKHRGFINMIRRLMAREGIRERLLAHPDGDRRLTNLLHLVEILHRRSLEEEPGRAGLIKWLADRRHPAVPRLEEHQLRLESDARAVRILTVHRSKGLEFPVVFCPFGWEGSLMARGREVICHEPGPPRRRVLDLGSEAHDRRRRAAQEETLAENLRLLYVALTRARRRCFLVWGHINTAETSALAYVIHRPPHSDADILAGLKSHAAALSDTDRRNDLARLAAAGGGHIQVRDIPTERAEPQMSPIDAPALSRRSFKGVIDTSWRVSSYSVLVSRSAPPEEARDHDADPRQSATDTDDAHRAVLPQSDKSGTIFGFPRGARAGIFFHALLERLDFTDTHRENRETCIANMLRRHGFDVSWTAAVAEAVERVLATALTAGSPAVRLMSINRRQRLDETSFFFPLKPVTPSGLRDIFAAHAGVAIPAEFPSALEKLVFAPSRGFLKGVIDMIFVHAGRYYLVDWKSNHLGNRIGDYGPAQLHAAMSERHYILQYGLYTLALDRYLKMRVPGYRYDRHFGGVFYLFIRGMDPKKGPASGVYYERPEAGLIGALDRALIAS